MSIQTLHTRHVEVWQALWTTGFGISHSYADNAINGAQVTRSKYLDELLKNGPFPATFFFIFVFSIQLTANVQYNFFADDWIRTVDLWNWK